jgi:hypothetical protein
MNQGAQALAMMWMVGAKGASTVFGAPHRQLVRSSVGQNLRRSSSSAARMSGYPKTDMSRQENTAESVPIIEQIQALSKEELVELIVGRMIVTFYMTERDITAAKAAVLRKKAGAAWDEYEAFQLPEMPSSPSLDQYIEWLKRLKEKNGLYRRYDKLWKKANKIEFGT